MVGLFSLIDALLNVPMPDAIQLLPFSKEVREALLTQSGPLGSALSCVLAYESGNWSDISCRHSMQQQLSDAISTQSRPQRRCRKSQNLGEAAYFGLGWSCPLTNS